MYHIKCIYIHNGNIFYFLFGPHWMFEFGSVLSITFVFSYTALMWKIAQIILNWIYPELWALGGEDDLWELQDESLSFETFTRDYAPQNAHSDFKRWGSETNFFFNVYCSVGEMHVILWLSHASIHHHQYSKYFFVWSTLKFEVEVCTCDSK